MVTPTPLRSAPRPTATEEIKAEAVALLEEALADAKAGKVAEVLIVLKLVEGNDPDTAWRNLATSTLSHAAWIGYLAQTQFDWMMEKYLHSRETP